MSERKVLSKYYPPDFDPSKITRQRKSQSSNASKLPTVTLMTPFSMRCNSCGEFIYKGRKFNARKETTDEKYYNITIYRLYIRCTACSAEIAFKTDPKNTDYECEKGAKRNFEPWREAKLAQETEEERLDRLEKEEGMRDVMVGLEAQTMDAKTEIAVADALDEIRTRNARREIKARLPTAPSGIDHVDEDSQAAREDARAAQKAFVSDTGERVWRISDKDAGADLGAKTSANTIPSFQRNKRQKKDHGAVLGIKRK